MRVDSPSLLLFPLDATRLCVHDAQTDFLPVYQQQLKDMIIGQVDKKGSARDRPLEGLKVIVNAGNGMGGFLADTLSEVIFFFFKEKRVIQYI